MDLLLVQINRLSTAIGRGFLVGLLTLLTACSLTANSQHKSAKVAVVEQIPAPEQTATNAPPLPLTADLVYYVLMAEIAGQRGAILAATDLYSKAANSVDSPALAGRSAQIANFTRDQKRIAKAIERWVEVDPTNADVYILLAPYLMAQGDYDAVVTAVDTALALSPHNARTYLAQIADNLSELASHSEALDAIQKLYTYQQNDPEALFIYARLAAFYKYYDDALPVVTKVVKQHPYREDAVILQADILQRLGRGNEGLALLKKATNKATASDDLKFAYAKLLGENNQLAPAAAILKQLNTKRPENQEVLFALGLLALEQRDGNLAKTYFSQLVKLGDKGQQAAYFMGLAEEYNENIEAALMWFSSVSRASQRFQSAQTRYVNLLADNGQLDKARSHFKLLRKENLQQAIQYYLLEASFLREQGQDQAAFDLYGEALQQYPHHIELLYSRAMVAEPLNRLSVLEHDLNKVLALDPNNTSALNALGYALTDRIDRHQEALLLIQKAVDLKPNDPFYLDSLGWVHYGLGNLDEAVRYLKQAVMLQDDAEFVAHLGEVLWQQGKKKEAKLIWSQAFSQEADNELLNQTMRRFGQ